MVFIVLTFGKGKNMNILKLVLSDAYRQRNKIVLTCFGIQQDSTADFNTGLIFE